MRYLIVSAVCLFLSPLLMAKKTVEESVFRDVAGELRCPTCTGLSVLDSDAKFSVQIKDEVREQLEKGVENAVCLD